jgi:magnesium transporter
MIALYDAVGSCLVKREATTNIETATVWIDLLHPTDQEENEIEKALGIDVPTRAEMREIEASNRFYSENGAQFMTAFVIHANDKEGATTSNVTFILTGNRLVTVRYGEPKAFTLLADRACRNADGCSTGPQIMISLIETLIQRQADLIEKLQDGVETLAPEIFGQNSAEQTQGRRLEVMLRSVGKQGDTTSRSRRRLCIARCSTSPMPSANAARTPRSSPVSKAPIAISSRSQNSCASFQAAPHSCWMPHSA